MKRKVGPARVLSVILSATFALTNVVTASATSGDDAANLSSSQDEAAQEVSVEAEESTDESGTAASEAAEDAPLFEKVNPEDEDYLEVKEAFESEVAELPVEEKDPEEQTRVIIVMEGDSVLDKGYDTENLADNDAAMNLSDQIIAEQEETVEKIEAEALDGETLDVNYNLSIITNAVSADVAYKDIASIVDVDGVEAVYVAQQYEPLVETANPETVTAGEMVGSYTSWATGYTGAGTRIAIIDTGIDSDHPSFDEGAFKAHLEETAEANGKSVEDYNLLTEEEIAAVLPNLNVAQRNSGVTADQLYVNEKIGFAFNYVDRNLDITHDNDSQGDHGTHVSGIATANYYVPNASSDTGYARQDIGVVGVAPDAQLITMKVFGTKGGAYSDDYMAAIEDAILLKADVVNLSLGSSAAGYSADSEAYINGVFDKLQGTSTVVSISAGNSGRWADDSSYGVNLSPDVNQDTVGSPGSYYNAFTVASAVNTSITAKYFDVAGQKIFYYDGNDTKAPKFATLAKEADGTEYPFVFLRAKGLPADYEGVDVAGKIVFVQRGECTFGEKQMYAEAAGATAVIIYNNQPGTINMTLQGSTAVIPAISITLADGEAIAASATQVAEKVYEGTLTVVDKLGVNYNVSDGYTMSDFSSYGVPGSLDLKPEITAPGGNIYSTTNNGTYGIMSGTSMAAPSITGQSALVEQYIRENGLDARTGLSVRTLAQSLLMSTAVPLHEGNDPQGLEYSPRSQGAGLGNAYNAISTPTYVLVGDKEGNDGKVKAVLGDDPEKNGNYSFSFDLYNLTDVPQYYTLDASVLSEQLYAQGDIKYFAGTSHKLNPVVSLTADNTTPVFDLDGNGAVNSADQKAFLKVVNGTLQNDTFDAHPELFDLNGDDVVNTKDVYLFNKKKDVAAERALVEVTDKTTVNVNITLSDEDREYLAQFENGMYVDGFVYVDGNVDHSVPFLAFYGDWADSSMFEPYDFYEATYNKDYPGQTYTGVGKTNFLSIYPLGDVDEYYYSPNMFVDEDKYLPERNAFSAANGSVLGGQYYSLIRNASRVITTITDKNTGEVYFENTKTENYAAFVYQGQWENTLDSTELNWKATDKEGNPLPEGTEVEVTLQAIPSYYDDVEDPSTLKNAGLYLSTPLAIDNTEPELVSVAPNEEDPSKLDVTIKDNRYVAALLVYDKNGKALEKHDINQEELGVETVVTINKYDKNFFIDIADYALNITEYRVNNSNHEETQFVDSITIDQGEEIILGTWVMDNFTATVGPDWLAEGADGVTWSSSDEDVCYVLSSGLFMTFEEGECIVTATTVNTTEAGEHLTAQIKVIVNDALYGSDKELPENLPEDVPAEFRARFEQIKAARAAEASSEASSVEAEDENVDDAAVAASSEVVEEASDEASSETSEDEVVEDQAGEAGSNEEVVGGENDD